MMGGDMTTADNSNDTAEIAAIRAAIDHGITHIDTAEAYGTGHCEELVGEAIKGYDRSTLTLTSKLRGGTSDSREAIFASCQKSLERLGTDYLDLYLLHSYVRPGVSIENVMRAMNDLLAEGLVKNIGVCNMTINRFEEAQKYSENQLVCNQLEYSLEVREAEHREIVRYCQDNDIFLTAWGPLQKGKLASNAMLQDLAHKYGKTPYQIALNWLISQPNVVTIPKTASRTHLEENLGALGWQLNPEDLQRLTQDFPNRKAVSDRVPLDYAADVAP